jgi:hypothetical protein
MSPAGFVVGPELSSACCEGCAHCRTAVRQRLAGCVRCIGLADLRSGANMEQRLMILTRSSGAGSASAAGTIGRVGSVLTVSDCRADAGNVIGRAFPGIEVPTTGRLDP